jgi:peptide/nickel transport system substrate-binding protein
VTFQFTPRESARAAALLSGSVDVINDVASDMEASFKDYTQTSVTSYILMYLSLDESRDNSPYIKGPDGKPLSENPFKKLKVRQALMASINRGGIIKFLMKSDATATDQLVPPGFFGYDSSAKPADTDLVKARTLLAEGGYPKGFQLALHCPNNRFANDARLCEAIGQTLSQIGIRTDVVTMPFSTYLTHLIGGGPNGDPEFNAGLVGTGAVTGDSLTLLTSLVHGNNKSSGFGANNFGRYSNPAVDVLIGNALSTTDEKDREGLQRKAAQTALQEGAIIPLLHINVTWAMKNNLTISPRADGFTMATDIRSK